MKKFLSTLFAALLLSSLFVSPAFACDDDKEKKPKQQLLTCDDDKEAKKEKKP